jgi:hypothetical protein
MMAFTFFGIEFLGVWLLAGTAAGAIPWVLHLLSRAKAQEILFPTLRFLRISMEKTARRRRIQQWLLLIVRTLLLMVLAWAVAQPFTRAAGGWTGEKGATTAIILDNSYSMLVQAGAGPSRPAPGEPLTRLKKAKDQIAELLDSADQKPGVALLATSNGPEVGELTGDLGKLRAEVERTTVGYGRASLAARVVEAVEKLKKSPKPQKDVYIFGDLHQASYKELAGLKILRDNPDIHVMVVNTGSPRIVNIGIGDLKVTGRAIVDANVCFSVTVVNSGLRCEATVGLRVDGNVVARAPVELESPADPNAVNRANSAATVNLYHVFPRPGCATGEVFVGRPEREILDGNAAAYEDDLALDNARGFALDVSERIQALIVRGHVEPAASGVDPGMIVGFALDPYSDMTGPGRPPWPIASQTVEADQFKEESLKNQDVVFFCEMPSFSDAQADAVARFVRDGGTAVFFLGAETRIDSYNQQFGPSSRTTWIKLLGGLLPGEIQPPVGEVGADAPGLLVEYVGLEHPYLAKLYENESDYPRIVVKRYFPQAPSERPGRMLLRLPNGQPLLQVKDFGAGRVVLCTSTATPKWSTLPTHAVFLPIVYRACMLARQEAESERGQTLLPGAKVTIQPRGLSPNDPGAGGTVEVMPPAEGGQPAKPIQVRLDKGKGVCTETSRVGLYRWKLDSQTPEGELTGAFVISPFGQESRLEAYDGNGFTRMMRESGIRRLYVGGSLTDVWKAAQEDAKKRSWLDYVLAIVVLLLVTEAIVANRRKLAEDAIPVHLNPRTA